MGALCEQQTCFKNPSYNVFSRYSRYSSVQEICTYSGAQCSAMQTDKTRYMHALNLMIIYEEQMTKLK